VDVCGRWLGCNGLDVPRDGDGGDGLSNPACGAGDCCDVMEGLGSVGGECNKKECTASYVAFIKQVRGC
jgi:hypothetical protein